MTSDFVRKQLRLIHLAANGGPLGWFDPVAMRESFGAGTDIEVREEVLDRRKHLDRLARPSSAFVVAKATIAIRQAIGEDEVPVAANDNNPKPKPKARDTQAVRKSTGKFVRGSFAESLPMVMAMRNTPDHIPEPLTSSWSVDPGASIPELDGDQARVNEAGDLSPVVPLDMLLEITPSINKIREAFEKGEVVRGAPQKHERTGRIPPIGPIIKIGKFHFSDGSALEIATRVREGKVEQYERKMPLGAMLGTEEKLSPHVQSDGRATLNNRRLTAMLLGKDDDGNPISWRPYVAGGNQRGGKSRTPRQTQALLDLAIANSRVMPPVTYCPPGVASGTARFADQFVGVVTASTGKGGAVSWLDVFNARRDHDAFTAALKSVDDKTGSVLVAAMTARTLGEVGVAAGQSENYATFNGGGKRALVAANDNFASAIRKQAA